MDKKSTWWYIRVIGLKKETVTQKAKRYYTQKNSWTNSIWYIEH